MVHLQFYENCELSQVGKELGEKKIGLHRLFHFSEICKCSFSPLSVTNFFPPNLVMLSFNVFVSMVSFPKSNLCHSLKNKHKDHHVTVPMLSRGHS